MPPTLYLIDGHALAYRAYFALSGANPDRWQTSTGEPTAGIFGFASVLMRLLENDKPDYMAVAFDVGKTFRHEMYPEYKGTRAKMPDDLRPQIERIRQLVDSFNLPRLEMDGYEADDVLGSVARQAAEQGLGVKIITGDRDLLQLVNERVIVNLPGRSMSDARDYYPADVEKKLGVRPDQVVDMKALMGDSSDNIPGVYGIGEKTAQKLLAQYETLDGIYAHLDEIPKRFQSKLATDKEAAYLSQDLARIRIDLPVHLDIEQSRTDQLDAPAVTALFRDLEFHSLINRLNKLTDTAAPPAAEGQLSLFSRADAPVISSPKESVSITTQIVDTAEGLADLAKKLQQSEMIALDTETTSTDEMQAELVGISLAYKTGEGFYIPTGHKKGKQLPLEDVLEALRPSLINPKIQKIGHNLKYDIILLARNGLHVMPHSFDTMIAEWLLDPASRSLGLKKLAFVRLGEQMIEIEELIGTGKKQISMADVAIEKAAPYAALDAEICLRLYPLLKKDLERVAGTKLLYELEMPLIKVLAEMEMAGILLDIPFFKEMSVQLETRLIEIEKQVIELVGKAFNLNSTQQLSDILFNRLGLQPPDRTRKTKSGHYSTSAAVLEGMHGDHPVVDLILEQRELSKLKSTYVDALPAALNPATGRVHTSFNQTGSVTGRLASSNPNLQNIPIRSELGRRVRKGFIAEKGNVLLAIDYSQIELRIVAHMAQDETMLAAFRSGQDIHATTAAAIYGVRLEEVTKDMRRHAKAVNFGLIYGMSAFGLTRSTELTLAESEDFVTAYFVKFPGVKRYLDNIRIIASEQGYVETLLGRRRYFPSLKNPSNQNQRNREEREAINAPIQGTAADIMKIAMLDVAKALQGTGLHSKMLLQVHDEVVIECPQNELDDTIKAVTSAMESAYKLDIPLSTEARWGLTWGDL
ncbi:MAG: DNA polymerase I [Anaerolineales bacterium]|uniref:DNA polymerase I n=1 Tax=Candidatus Desulfolinea nitratireducens TaxID=2841698 RepID=A0A8J6NKP4_9CHLR|nr:DNA polymerase I [Candidatus Desulfolinea nitratireducens]MBL6960036.1 DNA polymerase I [Anaerolineales bacterium]